MTPVRKPAPVQVADGQAVAAQPDRTLDAAPAYAGEDLCECGSGKPRLRSGRCRSCAAKLSNRNRKSRVPQPDHEDQGDGSVAAGLSMVPLPTYLIEAWISSGREASGILADLRRAFSAETEQDSATSVFRILGRVSEYVSRSADLLRSIELLSAEAFAIYLDEGRTPAAPTDDPVNTSVRHLIVRLLDSLRGGRA